MTTMEYKKKAIESIQSGDEDLARMVYVFIETYKKEKIVGSVAGKNLTQEDLIRRAEASEEDIAAGRTMTLEEFREEMSKW